MRRTWLTRLVALVLGGWAVVLLTRLAGADEVLVQLSSLTRVLGWLFLLEAVRIGTEVGATATQLGRYVRPLGTRRLIRGHLLSYAANTLAPAGRLAGEALKATYYAPTLGRPVAAALALRIQAASLLAGSAMSAVCVVAALIARGPAWLWLGLIVHTLIAGGAGAALTWAGRRGRATRTARGPKLPLKALEEGLALLRPSILGPAVFLFLGRCVQVGEMGALLGVLSQTTTLIDSLAMEGLLIVGTAAGDLIPGQIGATDAAFTFGASTFAAAASQGLAVAAAIHIVQLCTAVLCSVGSLVPGPSRRVRFSPLPHLHDTPGAR